MKLIIVTGLLALSASTRGEVVALEAGEFDIELDGAGAVRVLRAGSASFGGDAATSGLFVRDGMEGDLLQAGIGAGKDRETALAGAGLRVAARIEARPDHLLVAGVVEDVRREGDRSVDVVFRLPFAPAIWWESISEKVLPGAPAKVSKAPRNSDALPEGAAVLERIESDGLAQNYFPLACVTATDGRAGLAMAIPPDAPCRFRLASLPEPGCVELQMLFGLSQAAPKEFKGRAPFRFIVYPADGRWGWRDALRRYYALFPGSFQRRTQASGLWLVGMPPLKDVSDAENYAFWQATRLNETPMAIDMGMGVYPYTIVGQREIGYIKKKITGYDDVTAALESKPETTQRARYTWEEVKALVETSGLLDAGGRRTYRLRETEWAGNSISFPVNPSPWLAPDAGRPTVAAHTFAEVERALRDHPEVAGFFVDSLGMWGSYENHRRDHFAAVRAPLSHDVAGRVCLPNWMPHVDYLRELRRRIGPRLVFANGARPGRTFCGFELDVLGMENSLRDQEDRTQLDCLRAMAGPKPALCLLNYPEEGLSREHAEEYVQRLVALGLAPEMRRVPWPRYKERDADLYARFMPIYRRLDRAGWQPVTHASVTDNIWVERFGASPPELYFTLHNPSAAPTETRLSIDREALGLGADQGAGELVEIRGNLDLAGAIALPAHALRVVQIRQ